MDVQKILNKTIRRHSDKKNFVVAPIFFSTVIVLFIITATNDLETVWKTHRFPFLDRSVLYSNPNDIIINLSPLRDTLNAIATEIGTNNISLYAESLNSGANIVVNKDLRIFPFSLAKLPLALVVMKKVERHELELHDPLEIKAEDQDARSGTLYQRTPGTKITVDALLKTLLIDSDNTAQHVLLRNITEGDMGALINETGLQDLGDQSGRISAKEYTRFYRTLFFSSFLTPGDSEKILKLLNQATFKDFLSSGVPAGIPFPHKYGVDVNNKIYLDSGIIYIPNRPMMITVMLQGIDKDQAHEYMTRIAKEIYNYISTK